jgi:hypothetical protein
VKDTHAHYWGDLRVFLQEEHEKVKAEVRAARAVDQTFDEGTLMAHYEVQALIEQLSTRGNESFLFELGCTIREAAERATRDAEQARRGLERSDPNPDRMFHGGRALRYRFIVAVMQEQAENFESRSKSSLSTGSIRTETSANALKALPCVTEESPSWERAGSRLTSGALRSLSGMVTSDCDRHGRAGCSDVPPS